MIFAFFSSCLRFTYIQSRINYYKFKKEKMAQKGLKILFILFIIASINSRSLAQEAETVKWYTIEEVQKLIKNEPRKIYIDMYTDWCGWCKVMDKKTFTDDRISSKLNSTFYAVKFDAEGKDPVDFKNQTYSFVAQGARGYHELAAALMQGKMSYPTSVFLDENLNVISPLPGYYPPEKLDPILEFIGEDHYKTTNYEQFLSKKGGVNN
jgi:thioredoxin-related protein